MATMAVIGTYTKYVMYEKKAFTISISLKRKTGVNDALAIMEYP